MFLGVDTGGTFTDFVLWDGEELRIHKVLSTPSSPEQAIFHGIEEMGVDVHGLTIIHGSTVATNAVLEGKGARTLFITNRGFADMLTIGRQAREELYNLQPQQITPPVPHEDCLETGGRVDASGEILDGLTEADLSRLRDEIEKRNPDSVAINLLFSFLNPDSEIQIETIIPEDVFVSRSSSLLPEYREYERGVATWLNSYVGPLVDGYLGRLEDGIEGAHVSVMQSSGNTISANSAGAEAVHMLLSGPAGGLAAAHYIGRQIEKPQLLTFDMGGTSTDVALIDGDIRLTSEGKIGRYPVAVPMVDMHTIGAGGGSIARVDDGGMLQVGPESAGASPGPACYGNGGIDATVTDANLLLGRLLPDAFLGGGMSLDIEAAERALGKIAASLGCSPEEAAEGIVRIANEHMSHALRVISVQRGVDPREFTLASFGGAGGLHVCALADSLGMSRAVIPLHGGVLSALGMLVAPRGRVLSKSMIMLVADLDEVSIEQSFGQLEERGRQALSAEGVAEENIDLIRSLDLRYLGQSFTLNIEWRGHSLLESMFHQAHFERYGHNFNFPVELVNIRVKIRERSAPQFSLHNSGQERSKDMLHSEPQKTVLPGVGEVPVFQRNLLMAGKVIEGPALITEKVSTSLIATGWRCEVDVSGVLLLSRV